MSISKMFIWILEDLIIESVYEYRICYGYKFCSDIVFEIFFFFVVVEVEYFDL